MSALARILCQLFVSKCPIFPSFEPCWHDSKSDVGNNVWVQVPPPAPDKKSEPKCSDFFVSSIIYQFSFFTFLLHPDYFEIRN